MRFDKWQYLYPPRPEQVVSKALLPFYANQKWIAQVKLNGTCSVFGISPDRKSMTAFSRHNEPHKAWSPSEANLNAFKNLAGDGWYVFVAELLHSKGNYKNTHYIHDILVADGEYLVGKTWEERQEILHALFPDTKDTGAISHTVIDDNTWLARNYTKGFSKLFESLTDPAYEGVVLKNPTATLEVCTRSSSNNSWQVKCRFPHKNYTS